MDARTLLPPTPGTPMTHVRGSVIANSQLSVRRRGLGEAYAARLNARFAAELAEVVAQDWVPLDVATAHYAVLEALTPDAREQWAIGAASGRRLQSGYLRTVMRLMRATGALTPERALARLRRAFERMVRGGSVGAMQTGALFAEVALTEMPLLGIPYFRHGLGGALESGLQLAHPAIHVTLKDTPAEDAATFLVTWSARSDAR